MYRSTLGDSRITYRGQYIQTPRSKAFFHLTPVQGTHCIAVGDMNPFERQRLIDRDASKLMIEAFLYFASLVDLLSIKLKITVQNMKTTFT
jgi:hypothetical protein